MATAGSDRQSLAPRGDDSAPTPLTGGRTLRALPQNASRPPPRAHSEQGPALPVLETGPSPSSPSVPLLSREHIRLPVDSSPPHVEPPSPFFPLQSAHRPKIISWSPKSGATNHRSYRSNRYLTYTILVVFMILLLPSPGLQERTLLSQALLVSRRRAPLWTPISPERDTQYPIGA